MIEVNSQNNKYNIHIKSNILNNINDVIDLSKFSSIVVLTDENIVKNGWLDKLHNFKSIVIKSGEINKNINTVSYIWKTMNDYGMDRKSLLINIGGGVVCDLGAFCASTYMRGIDFLQIPTTLLSQVDASVGGKTGFDFNEGKNIIGTFATPISVLIDDMTLKTLPKREYISGLAEVIKYGIIYDKDFLKYFEENNIDSIENNYIITRSCEIKADVVSKDFKENSLRKILNFGHTIGHAIESLSLKTNNPLLHGEAVAIGMITESFIAKEIGNINNNDFNKIKTILKNYNLPSTFNGNVEEIYLMLFKDKKNVSKKIKWVLPKNIGNFVFDVEVDENIIKKAIKEILI